MTIYVREVAVDNFTVKLYAVPEDVAAKSGLEAVGTTQGFSIVAETRDKSLNFPGKKDAMSITDEQSVMTGLILGEKRKVVDEMLEVARRLRIGRSQMKCFVRGCRKDAVYFAEQGDSGYWFACSDEHKSKTTSKGHPIKEDEYKSMLR